MAAVDSPSVDEPARSRASDPARPTSLVALGVVAIAGLVIATGALGYLTLFSTFAPHDDEGYFLVSIKGYLSGATLYDEIYSHYGPFFFGFMAGTFKALGLEVTNDGGRFITLAFWLGAAALLGLGAWGITRRLVFAVVVYAVAFGVVSSAPGEPAHPSHLLMLLHGAIVATAAVLVARRPRLAFVLIGALGAAELFTKVNIGVLTFEALVFAAILASPRLVRRRAVAPVLAVAFVLTPFALMHDDIGSASYARYAIHVSLSGLAFALASLWLTKEPSDDESASASWLGWSAAGALALAAAVVGVLVAQGTTLSGLAHGVVLDALNQRNVFSGSLPVPLETIAWDTAAVVVAAALAAFGALDDRRWRSIAGVARIGVGAAILLGVLGDDPLQVPVTLAWVAAIPPGGEVMTPHARFVRMFLPAFAILQTLHAYPVPGSQIAWSALLLVPVGAVCVADGLTDLKDSLEAGHALGRVVAGVALILSLWAVLIAVIVPLRTAWQAYESGVPIRTTGASRIHVPAGTAVAYESLASTIRKRCSTFVSSPGLNSLYLMSETTPPSWTNLSGWLFAFDAETQKRVVRQISPDRRLCAIRSPALEAFWAQGRPIPRLALYRFVLEDFRTEASVGIFEVKTRKVAERG